MKFVLTLLYERQQIVFCACGGQVFGGGVVKGVTAVDRGEEEGRKND